MVTTDADSTAVKAYLTGLQDRIVAGLEDLDGNAFRVDRWQRGGEAASASSGALSSLGGGGDSRRFQPKEVHHSGQHHHGDAH